MNIITDRFTLIHGDALEILPTITGIGGCRNVLRTWANRQWIYSRFDGKIVATLTGFQSFVRESPAVMFIHCAGGFPDDRARERNHARRQPPVSQTYLER